MTKRIFRSIFSVSAVILVISIGLILGLLYGHFGKRLEKELKQEAAYLALAVEKDGEESLAKLSKTGERVTLIDSDGTVLYDNKTDPAAMENHQDRSEVQEAEKSGEGYASRTSATLGKKTIYYALRLENGQILRVSSTQYTVAGILGGMIQPILVMIFLMLILSLAAAFHSSKKIVEPLNSLNLDDPKMNDTYDEITPLLSRINKQQKTIRQQLSNAKRQQEEFAIITNNMSEGLLVIDKQTELLSCNTSAVKLLSAIGYMKEIGQVWVLSSWQIVVNRYPKLGEKVKIVTLPYELKVFLGYRNFAMLDEQGEYLAKANSLWSLLDVGTGKPVMVNEAMHKGYEIDEKLDMEYAPRKIAVPEGGELLEPIVVKKHHLDTNHHVNNGQYVNIAMEYLPDDFVIRQMRAEYKKQAFLDDVLHPYVVSTENDYVICLQDEAGKPYVSVEFQGQ